MMDQILQFDWSDSTDQDEFFIDDDALNNCTIEKILQDRFHDPLLSTDDEDQAPNVIDWDAVFKKNAIKNTKIYVPGLRACTPHPKLSVLTDKQHLSCLKVLCQLNPHVLEPMFVYKPSKSDYNTFEVLKDVYKKEQIEFVEWAKSLWPSDHCIRAVRLKPALERIYDTEFKIRAQRLSCYPKNFDMAAQIPLESTKQYLFEAEFKETLVAVKQSELPRIQVPTPIQKTSTVLKPCLMPEICNKHPYQIVLPNESNVSALPISEIHHQLAYYAANNQSKFVISENAARCLVQTDRHWTIPISVCEAYTSEGEQSNVVVLDSEFYMHKEPAMIRTYRAMKHLLEYSLIPLKEREKAKERTKKNAMKVEPEIPKEEMPSTSSNVQHDAGVLSSDDEETYIVIIQESDDDEPVATGSTLNEKDGKLTQGLGDDSEAIANEDTKDDNNDLTVKNKTKTSEDTNNEENAGLNEMDTEQTSKRQIMQDEAAGCSGSTLENEGETSGDTKEDGSNVGLNDMDTEQNSDGQNMHEEYIGDGSPTFKNKAIASGDITIEDINDIIGVDNCTCADSPYEIMPRRSFKKWRLVNSDKEENLDVIIHCTHKARNKYHEVILEPIPEYQLELGASEQPPDRVHAIALALMLRQDAKLVNVRLCGVSGDIVTIDTVSTEKFLTEHNGTKQKILNTLHTTLSELQSLLPGKYLLQHDPVQGTNALLYVARKNGMSIEIGFDDTQPTEADEATMAKTPPTIIPVLMPHHKYRRILPCAFTPNENFVVKESKKPFTKKKLPPQAIKWSEKRRGKKKK